MLALFTAPAPVSCPCSCLLPLLLLLIFFGTEAIPGRVFPRVKAYLP
jgi:hypothetical protein